MAYGNHVLTATHHMTNGDSVVPVCRWMASKYRAINALLHNWEVTLVALEKNALTQVGCKHTSLTDPKQFLNLKFPHKVERGDGRVTTWVAKVVGLVVEEGEAIDTTGNQKLLLKYNDRSTDVMTVSAVVRFLVEGKLKDKQTGASTDCSAKAVALECLPSWQLYQKLTDFRTVITFHFMLDVDAELKILSKTFQMADVTLSDVIDCFESIQSKFELLKTTDGGKLREFWEKWDDTMETFKNVHLLEYDDGLKAFKIDRCVTQALQFM